MAEELKTLGFETKMAMFSAHLTTGFTVDVDENEQVELELTEVTEVKATPKGPGVPETIREDPFALLFKGPADKPLNQRIYKVTHPEVGEFALFMVPVGMDGDGRYYESVFN